MSDEPEAKKQKTEPTGWEEHTMNISEAIMKADEVKFLTDIANADVESLQGIGPMSASVLDALGVKSVKDLAKYKYFLLARALKTLSECETEGGRLEGTTMNVDKAVDKAYEAKSLKEICEAPAEALEGISKEACDLLETLGVKSIGDLAEFKYCRWAEAIVAASAFEETKTAKERKLDAALKKLA
eukprot:Nitzschia sp. Nitz4//scaffold211_size37880//3548//4105//NITZ4_007698-RA/size37880-processed-gene-0.0-mRNA-1//1//CDS//3329541955//8859//frame0